jgi:hypothetical protein
MSGAIPPLHQQYAFMAWWSFKKCIGTILPLRAFSIHEEPTVRVRVCTTKRPNSSYPRVIGMPLVFSCRIRTYTLHMLRWCYAAHHFSQCLYYGTCDNRTLHGFITLMRFMSIRKPEGKKSLGRPRRRWIILIGY